MSEWQPIKTAPKDGTRVLLFAAGSLYIGQWRAEANFGGPEALRPGWQIVECNDDPWYADAFDEADVIAWMPLPTPPYGKFST